MTDADASEVEVDVDPDPDQDAQSELMNFNLTVQGLSDEAWYDELVGSMRDAARRVARKTVDQVHAAQDGRDLAVEVADAVLDAVLSVMQAPAPVETDWASEETEPAGDQIPAQLRVRTWLIIDSVLDNAISIWLQTGVDGDEVGHAARLRERGWRANEQHPGRGTRGVGWAPDDDHLTIGLSREDRRFILDRLDEAAGTAGLLAPSPDSPESDRNEWEREVAILERVREEVRALDEGRGPEQS